MIRTLTLTLTGSSLALSSVLANPSRGGSDDMACRAVSLQPDGATANPIYIGWSQAVSSADYGVRLPASSGGVPSPPFILEFSDAGPLRLSDFWVLGNAGDKLHILIVPF